MLPLALLMASSLRSKRRRSRYLPLKSRSLNRTGHHPRVGGLVEVIRRADICDLPAVFAGRSGSASRPELMSCRHSMPMHLSRHSFEHLPFHREWRGTRSCLPPNGLRRVPIPLVDLTPPRTFGKGWTHAGGWRYESSELIHRTQQARPGCRCRSDPRGRRHHQPRVARKPAHGRINPFHF